MSIGIFTDKKHQPTEDEILKVIGPKTISLARTYPVYSGDLSV